jgi:hypothetical protein
MNNILEVYLKELFGLNKDPILEKFKEISKRVL